MIYKIKHAKKTKRQRDKTSKDRNIHKKYRIDT